MVLVIVVLVALVDWLVGPLALVTGLHVIWLWIPSMVGLPVVPFGSLLDCLLVGAVDTDFVLSACQLC